MDWPHSVPGVALQNGKFTDGNPLLGIPASLDPAAWANQVTEELVNVLLAAGVEPSEEESDQLLKAVRTLRGGALNFGFWQFSAAGGNPVAGYVTLNNADPGLASSLLIAESSAESLDYSTSFGLLRAGDTVSIQERDAVAVSHRYRVSGPVVDHGAYREIPVSYVSGNGGGPAVDTILSVLFSLASAYDDTVLAGRVTSLEGRPRGVGDAQTWQDVTASRAANTTYTNTTGRPITVVITCPDRASGASITVAGVVVCSDNPESNVSMNSTVIVPDGSTYLYSGSISRWAELR